MRKDYILTPEQKQIKKQRLEENRLLRSSLPSPIKTENLSDSSNPTKLLTESDWLCLTNIQNAYSSAMQSTPSASSMISFELAPDLMSAFLNTIDLQNFNALKLINFLKEILEFEQLDEHDRLILVKYNLMGLMLVRHSLTFDSVREIVYDLDSSDDISPNDEAFAHHCKSLFILCYGYEFNRAVMSVLHALDKLINKNPIIMQLLMLVITFSKGFLADDDDHQPILNDDRRVFQAQSKYLDLLFRYMMEHFSFEDATMKMIRITQQLFQIQKLLRDFQQYVKTKIDVTSINPLMKSLLHFT